MIWAWIKSLFNPEPQKDPHLQLYEDPDYSTMSKGDLKKLLAQGKTFFRDVLTAAVMVYKFMDPCRGEYLWYKGYTDF